MAKLENNSLTVGPWPLPSTLRRSDVLGNLFTVGSLFAYELRPIPYDNIGKAISEGDISSIDDYVAPYSTFTLNAKAIPSDPDEVIVSCSFAPPAYAAALGIPPGIGMPQIRPFKTILEEPNPNSPPNRSGGIAPNIPAEGPTWTAPLSEEPYITSLSSGGTATLIGYFTEKAWYDREWILRYPNCLARVSNNGVQAIEPKDIPQGVPLDTNELFNNPKIVKPILSNITPTTWFPQTKADAELYDHPEMATLLANCQDIVSYKATEIKKVRFFFVVFIESILVGRTIPDLTWYPCFMTVQYNSKYSQQRIDTAIATPKTPKPLFIPPDAS